MAIRLSVSEIVRLYCRRNGMRITKVGDELGYKRSNFYRKLFRNKWTIEDLQKLKKMFDINMDDVLESLQSNITYK